MTPCGCCKQPAVADIPGYPWRVCAAHAVEFWTGLLAYARDHPPADTIPPAVAEAASHPNPVPANGVETAVVEQDTRPRRGRLLKASHWGQPRRKSA